MSDLNSSHQARQQPSRSDRIQKLEREIEDLIQHGTSDEVFELYGALEDYKALTGREYKSPNGADNE